MRIVEGIFDVLDEAPTADGELPPRYALGRNLFFIGLNVWLPYVYLTIVMRLKGVSAIPFGVLCAAGVDSGLFLIWKHYPKASH
jgi:hypothetical protein